MKAMRNDITEDDAPQKRLEAAYRSEKPRFIARIRATGRSLEEAEDLVHDVYAETMDRLSLVSGIVNLSAWINALLTRRIIDAWRRDKARRAAGETKVAEETLDEIISGVGLDPQDELVRDDLLDALNDALGALPENQRKVVEAQVFGGLTFREIAEETGESIDTLMARKRHAVHNLSRALRHWIEE
jgi:RNA polymerase sigma factor (sigma-70 family)